MKIIQVGHFLIKPDTLQIAIVGENRKVEPKVMAALEFFIQRPNQLISRDELIKYVWQGASVSDGAVNRTIAQIRRLFEHPEYAITVIETIPKKGYQWVASYESIEPQKTLPFKWFANFRKLIWLLAIFIGIVIWLKSEYNGKDGQKNTYKITQRLTSMPGQEKYPAIGPDNEWLAFSHKVLEKGGWDLYIKNILTEERLQLTDNGDINISPAWSNRGDKLAFVRIRYTDKRHCGIYLIEFTDQSKHYKPVKKLVECGDSSLPEIAWGKKDETIYYNDRNSNSEPYEMMSLALGTGKKSQLFLPVSTGTGFRSPAISADNLLAVADRQGAGKSNILWYDLNTEQVVDSMSLNKYIGAMGWYSNGKKLLISANDGYWSLRQGEPLKPVTLDSERLGLLTISTNGNFLVTKEAWHVENIHRMANFTQPQTESEQQWTESSQIERYPQAANNSNQLIYFSNRSGNKQIWLKNEQGVNIQLTDAENGLDFSAYKWSPSDKFIVLRHQQAIWKLDVETRQLEKLLASDFMANNPTWGKNDREIIVSSKRSGDWQLWHLDLLTGETKQLTNHGGYSARVLADGSVYYTKYHQNGLFKLMDSNGKEELVLADMSNLNWKTWQLFDDGVYFSHHSGHQRGTFFYDFATQEQHLVKATGQNQRNEVSISFEQKYVYFSQIESSESDIVKLE